VLPAASTPFKELCRQVDARCLHAWHALLHRSVDWAALLSIEAGALEATTRWLQVGEALEWAVSVETLGLTVRAQFVPAAYAAASRANDASAESLPDEVAEYTAAGSTCSGRWAASEPGTLWFCLDNTASWVKTATATVAITSSSGTAKAPPADLD